MSNYQGGHGDEEVRVLDWEDGLPSTDDLIPLSQDLISPVLAYAFKITPKPCRTMLDVNRASHDTLSSLRKLNHGYSSSNFKSLPSSGEDRNRIRSSDPVVFEAESQTDENDYEHKIENDDPKVDGSEKRRLQEVDNNEEDNFNDARAAKRPRLVWTPQLHKRFVEVIGYLGIRNAVPKNIMQLMNVDGLTRENVASHLQKYRLYLKRMKDGEGPSLYDKLFTSTPIPSTEAAAPPSWPVPMPYGHHPLIPVGTLVATPPTADFSGFDWNHYNMYREHQRDWSGNKFGSLV